MTASISTDGVLVGRDTENEASTGLGAQRRMLTAVIGTSGIVNAGDFKVTATSPPSMSVQVAAGYAYVLGPDNYKHFVHNETTAVVGPFGAADTVDDRTDIVCLNTYDQYGAGQNIRSQFLIVPGTNAAAGTSVAPATPADCLVLAKVLVAAEAVTVGTITDERVAATPFVACTPA
jgi:hypothetical protein